jgi:hypothetical protein
MAKILIAEGHPAYMKTLRGGLKKVRDKFEIEEIV